MTKTINSTVFCTLQIEGIHCWPTCPFDEVAYLRDPHRHVFNITAFKDVNHDDRDVEFIMLKHSVAEFFKPYWDEQQKLYVFGAMSCEMIARKLIERFDLTSCEVNEDGENGSILSVV